MTDYLFDRYRPQPGWYRHNPYGIHGLGHAARVLIWAEQVAEALQAEGTPVEMEVVRWAAAVHDVGRIDDGRDRGHGERSALWVLENAAQFAPALIPSQVERVAYLCTWHVPDDTKAPAFTPELTCLKDADALDRVRIFDLDVRRLRTSRAVALADSAGALFRVSGYPDKNAWDTVRRTALSMGLWR
jgi:hypothetical protein